MKRTCRHLYCHVPFCSGKCAYCGFYSVPYDPFMADRFLFALEREVRLRLDTGTGDGCETVYIGGGTPSVLSASQWHRFVEILSPLLGHRLREWTIEANPGTLSPDAIASLGAAGVNRISLGVQSLDDRVLAAMQRRHGAADVPATLAAIRGAGITNVGLDLIAGLPGVDAAGWRHSLDRVVALAPEHVSVYALGVEPETRLKRQVDSGAVALPPATEVMTALETAEQILGADGYDRYEISNYARPGRQCFHNLACWRGDDYLGLGPAASSRLHSDRWTNAPDLDAYCAALESEAYPPCDHERVDEHTDVLERILFQFRLAEGVPVESWLCDHGAVGEKLWLAWQPELARLQEEGCLVTRDDRWYATPRGREVLDAVLARLMV